jgi:hypothetical protein
MIFGGTLTLVLDSSLTTVSKDAENLQKGLDRGEWTEGNGMKINPGKCKAIGFTRARVKNPLVCSYGDQTILEASSLKYLTITLRSDLNWVDQVNYTAQKAWKAFYFVMHVLKQGDGNTKSLACMSLVVLFLNMGLPAGIYAEKNI